MSFPLVEFFGSDRGDAFTTGDTVDVMQPDDTHIGRNIRTLRKRRRLSLTELSRLTGIAASNLSSIELGKTSPTGRTLIKIAAAFNVRPGALLDEVLAPRAFLCRRAEGVPEGLPAPGAAVLRLGTTAPAMALDARLIRFDATGGPFHLSGEEIERFVHCVEGEISIVVDDETYAMDRGDSLHATGPLKLVNRGKDGATVLAVEMRTTETTL